MINDAPFEVRVEKDENKADNWHLILHLGYTNFIPLHGEFSTQDEAQEQADIFNRDIIRYSQSWCISMVKSAKAVKWLVPTLEGK